MKPQNDQLESKKKNIFSKFFSIDKNTSTAYKYLLPAFLVMSIITFYPLLYQVWMSFTDFNIADLMNQQPDWVGMQNYIEIFDGTLSSVLPNFDFWRLLSFNLWWTFSNVIVHVSMGIIIAVVLNTKGIWFKGFYRTLYVFPMILPSLVIAVVWRNMFNPDSGMINLALAQIGALFDVAPEVFRIRWLEQIGYPIPFIPLPLSYYALLITNIWLGWPFMTIVATGALQSIPEDLYEAASIDGASGTQKFFGITLPLLRPAMVPAAMYGIITTFNLFNLIYFVSGGGPLRQTAIMVTTAFRLVNEQRLYGMAAAFSAIIFLVLLGLTLLTNTVTRATERYDA